MRFIIHQFLFFTFSLIFVGAIYGQRSDQISLIGKPQIANGELIDNNKRDSNGEIASGIIIETDLESLTFESRNGIIDLNKKPGRYFVFLSPSERVLTIRSNKYKELILYLNDSGIYLSPGQVWKIDVSAKTNANVLPVNFIIEPNDANLIVDGKAVNFYNKNVPLALGKHSIQIEKEEYLSINDDIEVTSSKTLFSYTLEKVAIQALSIRTNPRGATLLIDNQMVGQTPYQDFKFPGTYQIKIASSGYKTLNQTIEIKPGQDFNETFNLQKITASLDLTIQPSDAKIIINQQVYDSSKPIELSPGNYLIEIVAEGYEVISESITLSESQIYSNSYALKQQFGNLQFRINNPDADVKLTGKRYSKEWKGLSMQKDIPVGQYEVVSKLNDIEVDRRTIQIEKDELATVSIFIDEESLKYASRASNSNTNLSTSANTSNAELVEKVFEKLLSGRELQGFELTSITTMQGVEMNSEASFHFDGRITNNTTLPTGNIRIEVENNSGTMFMNGQSYDLSEAQVELQLSGLYKNYYYLLSKNRDQAHSEGISYFDNKPYEILVFKNLPDYKFYVNPNTYLIDVLIAKETNSVNGEIITTTQILKDWSNTEGVYYPTIVNSSSKSKSADVEMVSKYESIKPIFKQSVTSSFNYLNNEEEEEEPVFNVVEKMPELIGGMKKLYDTLEYPSSARKMGIEGRVILQFVVNSKGDPKNIQVLRGIGGGCDEAAINAIRKMKWKPGMQRGKTVSVKMSLPITFKLSDNNKKKSKSLFDAIRKN